MGRNDIFVRVFNGGVFASSRWFRMEGQQETPNVTFLKRAVFFFFLLFRNEKQEKLVRSENNCSDQRWIYSRVLALRSQSLSLDFVSSENIPPSPPEEQSYPAGSNLVATRNGKYLEMFSAPSLRAIPRIRPMRYRTDRFELYYLAGKKRKRKRKKRTMFESILYRFFPNTFP